MAPTICEDDIETYNSRMRRHCSVINYVGRQTSSDDELSNEVVSSDQKVQTRRGRESFERLTTIKRYRRECSVYYDSDSSDSIPSPMSFHNYAKRRKCSDTEDDTENYISTSSESNDRSVSSTISFNEDSDRENSQHQPINYSLSRKPLAVYSPVSSTTGALALYRQLSKTTPRSVNPYYQQDLMEIAMKTIILLQKNRSLHARLHQLKLETHAFVNSVMSNPENAKLRQTLNQSNDKPIDHSTSKVLAVKNQ